MKTLTLSLCVLALTAACAAPLEPTPPRPTPQHGTPSTLELTASPGTGATGGTAAVVVRVLDAFATPLASVKVALETTVGTIAPGEVTTDENGRGTALLSGPAGAAKVTAAIANGPSMSTQVAIQPPAALPPTTPTPTPVPPTTGTGPLTVSLSATVATLGTTTLLSARVEGGAPRSVAWTFGDGASFDGASTSAAHTYGAVGTYQASVRVTDQDGRSASATTAVSVTAAPPPPPPPPGPPPSYTVTLAANPATVIVGGSSTLTATVTANNGAVPPTGFQWDCDNGAGVVGNSSSTFTCFYPTVTGARTAKVTVTGDTVSASATTTVTVTAPPLSVAIAGPSPIGVSASATFTATLSSTGPVPTSGLVWEWDDDGDGTTDFVSPSHGSSDARTTSYGSTGVKTIKVKVTDPATGRTATGSRTVTVQ